MANSGGIFFHPESHFTMVRAGMVLYGLFADGIVGAKTRAALNKVSISANLTNSIITPINGMLLHLQILAEELWEPLCNGAGSTECINPTIGFSQLPQEAQSLIWAEEGTFDDSVSKTLDVRLANCQSAEACVVNFTYPETHVCRYQTIYTSEPCQ